LFDPWMLAMIDEAGYNGLTDAQIEKVADSLSATGLDEINQNTFEQHCYKCGINPNNFSQADLDNLQEKLNK